MDLSIFSVEFITGTWLEVPGAQKKGLWMLRVEFCFSSLVRRHEGAKGKQEKLSRLFIGVTFALFFICLGTTVSVPKGQNGKFN